MRDFMSSLSTAIEWRVPFTVMKVASIPFSRSAVTSSSGCPTGMSSYVEFATKNGGSVSSMSKRGEASCAWGQSSNVVLCARSREIDRSAQIRHRRYA